MCDIRYSDEEEVGQGSMIYRLASVLMKNKILPRPLSYILTKGPRGAMDN